MPVKNVTLTIDNKTINVPEDKTILEAALDNSIYIPHLCSQENLHPAGACRMCVVKLEGTPGVITSCSTRVREGMIIHTRDELAEKVRKLACDFMSRTHPHECTGCPKYGKCLLASTFQLVGDTGRKLRSNPIMVAPNAKNPIILHEMTRCILCGRCVRACQEMRGVGAIQFKKANGRMMVTVDGDSLNEAGCRFCSACVDVCPTGSIREQEAIAQKLVGIKREDAAVPCRAGCPANIDVPRYIRYVKEGRYSAATAVVREKAPFPNVLGHICSHPCELECKRNYLNEPISIRNLKRFAAERDDGAWREKAVRRAPTGKKAAIIGAGPAGLTAAYYMAKLGHDVTVFEALPEAGGMMRYGIPKHRLPREVLDMEIDDIKCFGVEIRTNARVQNPAELLESGFDVVFAAVGTHRGIKSPLPGGDLENAYVNADFLRDVTLGKALSIGDNVVVLGGGNVALDCASVARRLGAKKVHIACLEGAEKMTCTEEERAWANEEGVIFHNSVTFKEIMGCDGKVSGMKVAAISGFCFDAQGALKVELVPGGEEIIPADSVIFALGQKPDIDASFGLELGRGGKISVNEAYATSMPGVFAAGDAVTGTVFVITAIAGARKAAEAMDKYLGGDGDINEVLAPVESPNPAIGNWKCFGSLTRENPEIVKYDERVKCFEEMDHGFKDDAAHCEASRCLQCDLRLQIAPQKFWSSFDPTDGGQL